MSDGEMVDTQISTTPKRSKQDTTPWKDTPGQHEHHGGNQKAFPMAEKPSMSHNAPQHCVS